jgi:hypothetical protein
MYLPRTHLAGLAELNMPRVSVIYEQSHKLADLKLLVIVNMPDITLSVYSIKKKNPFPIFHHFSSVTRQRKL